MNIDNKPALLGIYLDSTQKKLLDEKHVPVFLIAQFISRIEATFGDTKIYCNYPLREIPHLSFTGELSEKDFLLLLAEKLPPSQLEDEDIDEVYFVYLKGISPLLSIELTQELQERHSKYLSQYSYSENLPAGIVPYFISREFVNTIPLDLKTSVHDFLLKNINNYDTEIFYKSPDLRQFRLDFSLIDKRSVSLTNSILQNTNHAEYRDIYGILQNNTQFFRLGPSYLEIEIYKGCEYDCVFCPRNLISDKSRIEKMEISSFQKILRQMDVDFPYSYTICLGGLGEPLLHSDLVHFLEIALDSSMERIYIETALYPDISLLVSFLQKLEMKQKSRIHFIVNLITLDSTEYKKLYKTNVEISSILGKIDLLVSLLPKTNVHVQMIKMLEVEKEIDSYFQKWEEKGVGIVLQKYNSYIHGLPERRVSDLTPIQREFCWHLARDFYIQANGDVAFCKQELFHTIGNINIESLSNLWKKGQENFHKSFKGEHGEIPARCLQCDEWYTFNA